MDRLTLQQKAAELLKKHRYLLLVVLCGILLMVLPGNGTAAPEERDTETVDREVLTLQQELQELLSHVQGAGEVRVLLTQAAGETVLYQVDEDTASGPDSSDIRRETVIVSDSGLVRQILPPVYRGAVILCRGGDDPAVRLAVVEAVADATGLTSDHITVLKMK